MTYYMTLFYDFNYWKQLVKSGQTLVLFMLG